MCWGCAMLDLDRADRAAAKVDALMVGKPAPMKTYAPDKTSLYNPKDAGDISRIEQGAGALKTNETQPDIEQARSNCPTPIPFEMETEPTPWPDNAMPDGMAQAVAAIAEEVQAPLPLAGFAVLSAVAHLAMRLTDANHPKLGAMPCSLFLLSQGLSGDRKSACYDLATMPIHRREREQREAYRKEVQAIEQEADAAKGKEDKAAILSQLRRDPRTIYTDGTMQKIESDFVNGSAPALSFSTDEGGVLLGGHSLKSETRAAALGGLTRLFEGKGVQRDRVQEGQSGFRFGVRFGLFLSAQPIILQQTLTDPVLRGQGFLPRFLFAAPRSLAGTRFLNEGALQTKASDRLELREYWDALQAMQAISAVENEHGGLELEAVGMEDAAVKTWLEFFNSTEANQAADGDLHHLGAFASRAGELAVRVAAVYAAYAHYGAGFTDSAPTVSQRDMQQACNLVAYSLSEWQAQADSAILSQTEKDAMGLLEFLHGKGWQETTRQRIAQNAPNQLRKDKQRRNAAIDELIERRWLRETGAGLAIAAKQKASIATATTATFATKAPSQEPKSSRSSESSSSNSPKPVLIGEREEL